MSDFEANIQVVVEIEEIPGELIANWNQTGIHYIPVSSWIMEKEGSKQVEIAGIDDKREIIAVGWRLLLPQLIYKGKTKKSLPSVEFPSDWGT